MKKIFCLLSIFVVLVLTSCFKELDNWYSETSGYDGRYVFKLMSEDMEDTYVDYEGYEIHIYNTAENVANEIWLDDDEDIFPIKCKFILTGNSSSFKSASEAFDQLKDNIYSTEDPPSSAPTAVGQTVQEEEKEYIRAAILEGKILPGAATSIGGNKTDSLYIKIKLYSGTATYESYEIPVSKRKDPEVAEFAWKFKSAVHDPSLDEIYVIGGYRHTGVPEDFF